MTSLSFSPDEKLVLSGSADKSCLFLPVKPVRSTSTRWCRCCLDSAFLCACVSLRAATGGNVLRLLLNVVLIALIAYLVQQYRTRAPAQQL